MESLRLLTLISLTLLSNYAQSQDWHSVANHGVVIEQFNQTSGSSFLPTSPGEVVIWSDEGNVIRELEREHAVVYPSFSSGHWYPNQEPLHYLQSGETQRWTSLMPGTTPTAAHAHHHTQNTRVQSVQPLLRTWFPAPPRLTTRDQGIIPWFAELEQRKNCLLYTSDAADE